MTFVADKVRDNGLSVLDTDTENLYACNAEPTIFAEASSTFKVGTKSAPTVGAPADGTTNGRSVTLAAIIDGQSSATDTVTHIALTDDSLSLLLVVEALSSPVEVIAGEAFMLNAMEINIPDA